MSRNWKKDVLPYCLAAVLLGTAFFLIDSVHGRWTEHRLRSTVADQLLQHGTALGNTVNGTVTMLPGLRRLIETSAENGLLDEEFETIASAFREQSSAVRGIQLIRNGAVIHSHSLHGASIPEIPEHLTARNMATEFVARGAGANDAIRIEGPIESARAATASMNASENTSENTPALVATIPVRLDAGGTSCLVAIVLDVRELLSAAAFATWDPKLRFALRDARGNTLSGDATVFAGTPERHRVLLLDGQWELAAAPAHGWAASAAEQVTGFRVAALLVAFLLAIIVVVVTRSRRLLRHLVDRRTNELEALNAELRREIEARRRTETELIAALDKAEHADRLKDSFIATMSHEIRTPLHVILGYVDLLHLSNDQGSEELATYRQSMKNAGRRLMRSVEELLHISSLRAGTFTVNPEDFDLVDMAREMSRQFQTDARERGISLLFRSTLRGAMVYADRYSLEQALQNLIDNAIKYTEAGEVEIFVHGEGNDCTLSVRDTGIGISEDYLRHVFDVFSQEKTGYSRPYDGLGLGLSLTRQFIELNHGRIELRSRQGEGTECTIAMPTVMPVDHGIAEEVRMDATPRRSGPSLTLIQHVSQVA